MRSPPPPAFHATSLARRLCACATLLAGLAGCRSVPLVADADADAVMAGLAGPVDSVDAPFTVTLERARWRMRAAGTAATRTGPGKGTGDFWSDIAQLDVAHATRSASSVDERTFVLAMQTLLAGDHEAAAIVFLSLHARATDPLVRARARIGLTMALTWRSDWDAIARLESDPDSAQSNPRDLQAAVERWALAFAGLPPVRIEIPETPVVLPMRRSAFGTPVVTVMINGRPSEFWLDTGASMTLMSADVAVRAGVRLAAEDTLALGVVTGHIEARAVFVDSLALGGFKARGLTAALVSREMLRLDQTVKDGVVNAIPIDGVIGADLMRHMDMVIDAGAGTLTIRRPRRDARAVRNLFWVGYPVVRLVARDGQPLLFGLDTGADGTVVTSTLLRKLPRTLIAKRRGSIKGLGTESTNTEFVVRDIRMSDGDYAVTLRNAPVTPERRWTFVQFDGIMGSDVALAARLHLDFTNGVFDIRPASEIPAADPTGPVPRP